MKINLRESLNKIDLATDNKYDLLNTFDSKKLSDENKKKLAEAIENNSMASVNRILHESEEQLFKVVIQSGATKRNFESALYEDEAEEIVDYYGGRWIDENGFEWNMYIEEDDDSTEHAMVDIEESLPSRYWEPEDDRTDEEEYQDWLDKGAIPNCDEEPPFENLKESYEDFFEIETNLRSNSEIKMSNGSWKVDTIYLMYDSAIDDAPHLIGYAHDNDGNYDHDALTADEIVNCDLSDYMDGIDIIDVERMIKDNPKYFYTKFNDGPIKFDESTKRSSKSLEEASYGGAYDIEDDMFFTKEEIVELADEVCSLLKEKFGYDYETVEVGMVSTTDLYLCIQDIHGVEEESTFRIDMRKIRKPSDLFKYAKPIAGRFAEKFEDEYQYYDFDESLTEDATGKDGWADESWSEDGERYTLLVYRVNGKDDPHGSITTIQSGSHVFDKAYIYLGDEVVKSKTFQDRDEAKSWVESEVNKRLTKSVKNENTIKQNGKWVNKGSEGTHGKFKTKKAADAQRKAMFANGYKAESLKEDYDEDVKKVKELITDANSAFKIATNLIYFIDDDSSLSSLGYEALEMLKDVNKTKYRELLRSISSDVDEEDLRDYGAKDSGILDLLYDSHPIQEYIDSALKYILASKNSKKNDYIKKLAFNIIDEVEEDELARFINDDLEDSSNVSLKNSKTNDSKSDDDIVYGIKVVFTKDTDDIKKGSWFIIGTGFEHIARDMTLIKDNRHLKNSHLKDKDFLKYYAYNTKKEAIKDAKNKSRYYYDGEDISVVEINLNDIDESLKEAFDDEIDIDYETDFDDDGVEEGNVFVEGGVEYAWVQREAGPLYLDFDKWAVWSAREYVDPREFMTIHDDGKGYDFDGDGFKKKAMAAPVNYFVVDEDTGFIDWGPVETQTEAQDFLNGKVEDWEKDESLKESFFDFEPKDGLASSVWEFLDDKNKLDDFKNKLKEKYPNGVSNFRLNVMLTNSADEIFDWVKIPKREYTPFLNKIRYWDDEAYDESLKENKELKEYYSVNLHYEDIGDGREYDYEADYDDVLEYLIEYCVDDDNAPEDTQEYMEWVVVNFDYLFKKYENALLKHFYEDASQEEYDERHSSYEPEYDPMD